MRILFLAFLLSSNIILSTDSIESSNRDLPPCPKSPNCVSTKATKRNKKMAPIPYQQSQEIALEQLLDVVSTFDNAVLVEQESNYLHYEFTTKIGKFIDDVEFLLDDSSKVIHFRSASRVGYGDFNKNKRRMKSIVKVWENSMSD